MKKIRNDILSGLTIDLLACIQSLLYRYKSVNLSLSLSFSLSLTGGRPLSALAESTSSFLYNYYNYTIIITTFDVYGSVLGPYKRFTFLHTFFCKFDTFYV